MFRIWNVLFAIICPFLFRETFATTNTGMYSHYVPARASTNKRYIVQYVCFDTSLPAAQFKPVWQPFATSFLGRGIDVLILNERQDSCNQSVPFRFISQNWWTEQRFEEAFPTGEMPGNVSFGPVRVSQAGGFYFSDCLLPSGVDPTAPFSGFKLLALGRGPSLNQMEIKAALQETGASGALFFTRAQRNRENLFDWLLELRSDRNFTGYQHQQLYDMILSQNTKRQVQLDSFHQSLRLTQ